MADTTATLGPVVANGSATAPTKVPVKAVDPVAASGGEEAGDEGLEDPKATFDGGDDEGVDDEYDFEEEQQAVEGEDDEYSVPAYQVDEEDDEGDDDDDDGDYHDADGEGDHDHDHDYQPEAPAGTNGGPAVAPPAPGGKPNLTALLLGDPNAADDDEDDFKDGDSDEDDDAEYNGEYDDQDDEGGEDDGEADDYMEESTPITPTSRKRGIEEAKEDDEDAGDDAEEEGVSKKKVKA